MNIFSLLSYINKVSLLAFFITTLVVGYQIYILKKEKTKEQTPLIPDFKEKSNIREVANFTNLPSSLTKKELKKVNYSKLIFLIISLLTVMVVIFVLILIKKNSSSRNQALVNPTGIITQTPALKSTSPSPIISLTMALSPSPTVSPTPSPTISPTMALSPSTNITLSPPATSLSPLPTEIVIAQAPSLTPTINPSSAQATTNSKPQVLPETGNIGKGLLIFAVAISTIFFSFWF